jgi:hypothetical protein
MHRLKQAQADLDNAKLLFEELATKMYNKFKLVAFREYLRR